MSESGIIIAVVGVIVLGVIIYGWVNSCPECKKWFSKNLDDKEEINRSTCYETVTRTDVTKNAYGKVVSRTRRKEQVRMTYYKYRDHYSCATCSHKWIEISAKKVEG